MSSAGGAQTRPKLLHFYGGRGCPFLTGPKGTKKPPGDDGESIFRRRAAFNLHTISPGPPIVWGRPDGALFLLTGAPHGDTFPPPMLPPPVLSGEICAPTDKGAWCSSADWCAGERRSLPLPPPLRHHRTQNGSGGSGWEQVLSEIASVRQQYLARRRNRPFADELKQKIDCALSVHIINVQIVRVKRWLTFL